MINIKKIREAVGYSQEELGEALHLSREMISKMETGRVVIQPRTISALQVFLRENNYILQPDGSLEKIMSAPVNQVTDSDRVRDLQDRLINQQTLQIKNLESMVAEKLLLFEAYQKVLLVEVGRISARIKEEDQNVVSRRLVEQLRIELEQTHKDTLRHYSFSSGS
jgi:transcriptional regulator with XRE-family HTH domain